MSTPTQSAPRSSNSHNGIAQSPLPRRTTTFFVNRVRAAAERFDTSKAMLDAISGWEAETTVLLAAAPILRQVLAHPHVCRLWVEAEAIAIVERVLSQDVNVFRAHLRLARHVALRAAQEEAKRLGLEW